jgi:hypothetical protein
MRKTIVFLGLALAAAGTASAQPTRGAFAVDAIVAPTTSIGFGYYITEGLSIRPWLGIGYSDYGGFFANASAQLRFEPKPSSTLAPYVSLTAQYSHQGTEGVTQGAGGIYQSPSGTRQVGGSPTGTYQQYTVQSDFAQVGGGAGLRYRLGHSVSLFAEGRIMYSTSSMGSYNTGWSTIGINDQTRAEVVLGLTYLFH